MEFLRLRLGPTALACLGAATTAILGCASPAAADVAVTPAQAVQGDAGRLVFRVTNRNATATLTRIELQLPAANPIAEVYPLSVAKWAPKITSRPADGTLTGLHGGRVTDTTSAITWTPASGSAIKPGASVDLPVALGPLPQTPQLVFTVVQTYADGSVSRASARPAGAAVTEQVSVTLAPAAKGAGGAPAAGGHAHGGAAGANAAPRGNAAPGGNGAPGANGAVGANGPGGANGAAGANGSAATNASAVADASPNWSSIAGWVCAVLIGGCALIAIRRGRREQVGAPTATEALSRAGAGTPGPRRSDRSGVDKVDGHQPEVDNPTSDNPTSDNPTSGKPDAEMAGAKVPVDKPHPRKADTAKAGTAKAGTAKAGTAKAGTGKVNAPKAAAAQRVAAGTAGAQRPGAAKRIAGKSSPTRATADRDTKDRSAVSVSAGEPQPQPASAGRWTYRDRR